MSTKETGTRDIAVNRKARHNYHILEKIEAGIALLGTEVKSVREGHISIAEAYVVPRRGELWLESCRINPYEQAGIDNHDPMRPRKLLLKRREIEKLRKRVEEKGLTLIPLRAYFSGRVLKIEVGLAEGKKQYDKREAKKEKDVKRRLRRLTDI